jgi:UDP-2-acetamido-3-amino-2,3-dideoxy-glucuronate N-acetyltransferase
MGSMKKKKIIGLIGAGYWGKNHLRNLHELGVLNTVFDINDKTIAHHTSAYPDVRFTKEEDKILENPDVLAVVIAAPAEKHYKLVRKYLHAGKDVLVEKPLALSVEEGEELVRMAESERRVLMVGHVLQYHPAISKLKEIIDFGDLGDIRYIYSSRLNLGKLRVEENVLWSFAPHDISVILMLLNGLEPKSVHAFGGSYISKGVFDTTVTEMEFENNVKGHIYVSWLHPFKEQKLIVIGSRKMAVFDDVSVEKLFLYPYKIDFTGGALPIAQKVECYVVKFGSAEPLREELTHFLDCVEKRSKPKTDGTEGLRVLRVLESAQKSLLGTGLKTARVSGENIL